MEAAIKAPSIRVSGLLISVIRTVTMGPVDAVDRALRAHSTLKKLQLIDNSPIDLRIDNQSAIAFVTIFTFFTHFLLSSKRPNTHSNHDMALSYLIFSHFKVTPSRRGKADSIGKPIKNYLLGRSCHDPLVLLIGLPNPIEVQLIIGIIPSMRPSLIIRLPIQVLINNLIGGQAGDLVGETDVGKRRRSRTEDGLPRNSRRRIGQFLNHPLEGQDTSLEVSNLQLTIPGILSVLLIKKGVKEDTP